MASLKGKQLNLLFQSIYAFGQRIPGFLPKTKFKLFGAVGCLHFSVSFSQALFLLAVISQLYFTTFWDLALKHLQMYLFGQYKKQQQQQNCWNSEELWLSSGTAQSIFFVLQRTYFYTATQEYPLQTTSYLTFYVLPPCIFPTFLLSLSVSPLFFSSFSLALSFFSDFLPLLWVSSAFFFFHSNLKAQRNTLKSNICEKGFFFFRKQSLLFYLYQILSRMERNC